MPLELRRHPEVLPDGALDVSRLFDAVSGLFDGARSRGEIPADTSDLDVALAFVGAVMGVGLLAHGLNSDMSRAVDILVATFDGRFFS